MRSVAIILGSIAFGILALLLASILAAAALIGLSGVESSETVGWDPVSLLMQVFGMSMNAAFATVKAAAIVIPLAIFSAGFAVGLWLFSTRVHARTPKARDN